MDLLNHISCLNKICWIYRILTCNVWKFGSNLCYHCWKYIFFCFLLAHPVEFNLSSAHHWRLHNCTAYAVSTGTALAPARSFHLRGHWFKLEYFQRDRFDKQNCKYWWIILQEHIIDEAVHFWCMVHQGAWLRTLWTFIVTSRIFWLSQTPSSCYLF